jgi:hypothetical protein
MNFDPALNGVCYLAIACAVVSLHEEKPACASEPDALGGVVIYLILYHVNFGAGNMKVSLSQDYSGCRASAKRQNTYLASRL